MGEGAPYAELHCHSNFSFLDGASHPDELVEEAARLGLDALAITDHDGMYGVVRFAAAAGPAGLATVFGAEVTLDLTRPQTGMADPEGAHLVVLARDPTGYSRLCKALSAAHLLGREKGRPLVDLPLLAALGAGADLDLSTISMSEEPSLPTVAAPAGVATADHWLVLTGCRKGPVPDALLRSGPGAARAELVRLQRWFGRDNVAVEIWDHGEPLASARNDALARLACEAGADVVATNNVHYHRPGRARLAAAMAAVRGRRSLDDIDGWLPAAASAHLRSGTEQARRFARYPGAVARAAELGLACAFDLRLVAPRLPPFPTPPGHTEMTWLRHLTEQGARHRYGPREAPKHSRAYAQIDYELDMIDHLGFPGYFLIVWDIVRFCNEADIYCQGRGSAANSAVCYALGITKADAVGLGLLFERFLSPERDGPPDIDVDIESERREEAIQYVYHRYGRSQAAQVANVITYRPRSAVRDMGKALGASPGQVDAWAKCIDAWGPLPGDAGGAGERAGAGGAGGTRGAGAGGAGGTRGAGAGGAGDDNGPSGCNEPKLVHLGAKKPPQMHQLGPDAPRKGPGEGSAGGGRSTAAPASGAAASGAGAGGPTIPEPVLDLARQTLDFPRHLGIHSGGMVICDRPVAEVCPVEWARMADRSVLQWDKEDCARAGLVKFDMLGLGMLSALHATVDHIKVFHGTDLDLADLPQDDRVYDLLCKADTVGVFQVESRAQMATLPRLRPRTFYDIVIEVALIRPGPIQGHSVHPYLRRRNGTEEITYLHPLLERSLKKTLGVPLFQEQLMQMAIDVAGFSGAEADQLRQAMGAKRSAQRMERLRARFYAGMATRGATGPVADRIWEQMAAFANFGFPESHSVSFAYLVYASAWLKLHYPAAFLAGLLDSQPMGFWSPQSLVLDSRRHGVEVRRPDVNASGAASVLEPTRGNGTAGVLSATAPGNINGDRGDGGAGGPAVRLSISYVRTIGDELAKQIATGRPYTGMEDLIRRCGLSVPQAEALATAGAFECFGQSRREALWAAGAIAQSSPTMARPSRAPRTGVTPAGGAGDISDSAGGAGDISDSAGGAGDISDSAGGAGDDNRGASGCNETKLVHLRAENRPLVRQLRPDAPRKAAGKDGPAEQPGAWAGPAAPGRAGAAGAGAAGAGPAVGRTGEEGGRQAATLAGLVTGAEAPPLPGMNPIEINRADLWATGLSPESYPTELFRSQLNAQGVVTAAALTRLRNGASVTVGGVVTHRQRPATAKGVIFVNLEDETGLVNVICTLPVWQRYGHVARTSPALLVRGKLEKAEGAINVLAISFEALVFAGAGALRSRDFH